MNQACSLIPKENWHEIRPNTNGVEVAHYKSNSTGRRRTLLMAILK